MTLLTLDEAKAALNITSTTYDSELQDYIDGAIAAVEGLCGPTTSTSATDVLQGNTSLLLAHAPVLTLTSVTGDQTGARDVADFRVDLDAGVITPLLSSSPLAQDWYTVVYTYGRTTVPPAMKQAAKIILKHQWSTQRGPSGRRSVELDAAPGAANRTVTPGWAYSLPNLALQMLTPYARGPLVG